MSIMAMTDTEIAKISKTLIAKVRYQIEHTTPAKNLVTPYSLNPGSSTLRVPKAGIFNANRLVEGEDMTEEQSMGLSSFDVSTTEYGLKIIITDKTGRELNESTTAIVAKQAGSAMGNLEEDDCIALFSGLNGGTVYGSDGKKFTLNNVGIVISKARAVPMGDDLVIVHHQNALFEAVNANVLAASPRWTDISGAFPASLLQSFYRWSVDGVPVFAAGRIPKESGVASGIGAIFDRSALGWLGEKGISTEPQRDASLRGFELVTTADGVAFEVDDSLGAGLQFEMGDVAVV